VSLGCDPVHCVLREDLAPDLLSLGREFEDLATLQCVSARTPSSLHTLALGLDTVPDGPVFCTMVDSVMGPSDWRRLFDGFQGALRDGADAALGVTRDVGGEGSLYAVLDSSRRVRELRDGPPAPFVTAGVYALAPSVRSVARAAAEAGLSRMRNFLRHLLGLGFRVESVAVERVVDLDRASDLERAAQVLHSTSSP